jgi:hypothetical protein
MRSEAAPRVVARSVPREAERAITAFVITCDFSVRDVQVSEMRTGMGPQKVKLAFPIPSSTGRLIMRQPGTESGSPHLSMETINVVDAARQSLGPVGARLGHHVSEATVARILRSCWHPPLGVNGLVI